MLQCCKKLHQVSNERIVWINALRNVCSQHGVSPVTFPVDQMTLLELEAAATSHYRFNSRLWNGLTDDEEVLEPEAIRVLALSPRSHPSIASVGNFTNVKLIPGGRFLLTATDVGLIQLWDLGHAPDILIQRQALATLVVRNMDTDWVLCAQPTSDGTGVIVLVPSAASPSRE